KLFKEAISKAENIGHNTFLWMLYLDFSEVLEKQERPEKRDDALQKAKRILQSIVGSLNNSDLKDSFLKSESVAKVLG
ncbi:MAG: hypothetical protein O6830_00105, partial [Candidatus Dadabacteria bacterium]|nr:hypothetical protein [Candidatus Dadabacteria bacterium]